MEYNLLIWPLLLAALVAFLATPLVIKIAWKIGIVDDPKKNKHVKVIHDYPVPRGGGLAIYAAILVATIYFLPIDKHVLGILIGATVILLMGILDDKYNLNPYLRIAIGLFAALIPIASGIGIAFVSNPFGGVIDLSHPQIYFHLFGEMKSIWIIADILALVWIVFMMNIINMGAKGIDGQLPGVATIAALTVALMSFQYSADLSQWPVIILASITAGAFVGFLPWNFYPQKIMPGYSGSTLAGYLLAILAILATTKVGILIVVLGVPIIDTVYTMVRRVMQGKSPVWGDRGHLHHKLLDVGLSKRQVVYFYWGVTALLGSLALNLNTSSKLYTIVTVALILAGLWVILHRVKNKDRK